MKIKVTDMQAFLLQVDACLGNVYLVYPQGGTENLKDNYMRQSELVDQWRESGQCLSLTLDVEEPCDLRRFKPLEARSGT